MARVTIDDVAKAAGVSTFTVSRALRGKDHVAAATREKVLRAAKELNYTASKAASSLASGRTNRIALLARERIAGWFIGELLDGMYDVLSRRHYDITVYRAGNDEERALFFDSLPTNRNADALIITGFSATQDEEAALTSMDMPIISVNSADTNYCQASIAIDDVSSEASAVRYLAAIGHRRFCYIGRVDPLHGDSWGYDARTRGYLDAITELNLTNCGIYAIDPQSPKTVRQAIAAILSTPERPTAICVWSDYYAVSVMHELTKNGINIPEDISVFGHDGSDMADNLELSTMAQPARKIGQIAAAKALALINGESLEHPHTILQTTLQPSATTAPTAAA